jgi:regulator of replication initiation timing
MAAATRRLQAEVDENTRLRKELDEARAKLDAIANIERSLNERKPSNTTPHP